MNDVDELKQYGVIQARARNIPRRRCAELLKRIRDDDRGIPGSWVWEWRRAGEVLERRGRLLEASRYYDIARFPYVDGGARRYAQQRCLSAFERWRKSGPDIARLVVETPDGQVPCWTTGLFSTDRRPVLLIVGGIVSPKEQWLPLLARARRLGMAAIAVEMPGVGENSLRYRPDSWRLLSAVLDAADQHASVAQTYAVTMGLGGHLAMRCAIGDARIKGIITAGAPVREFFTNPAALRHLAGFEVAALAHLIGTAPEGLAARLPDWALPAEQLAALDIPVHYLPSGHDEVSPAADLQQLRRHVRHLHLVENDGHDPARHGAETGLWIARSILQMRGSRNAQTASVALRLRAQRARRRLAGSTS
jgi:pimeloyl-ACP methyl ester carboxylesterase